MSETTAAAAPWHPDGAPAERVLVLRGSEWYRGHGPAPGMRAPNGRYCCLGLLARDYGVADRDLSAASSPVGLLTWCPSRAPTVYVGLWVEEVVDELGLGVEEPVPHPENNLDALQAMGLNDDRTIGDEERVEGLRPIFAARGIRIDFRPEE